MVEVSDSFKALATAAGREVSCIIEAGDFVFTDSDILSFEMQDVVHPDEMAIGTTCSNRFHFEVVTDEYIPLSAVIKPYIFFGGSDERCPLGVFYIAKRYRRRSRYSITCYDRMYQLDDAYETELEFPAAAADVLEDVCLTLGVENAAECADYTCAEPPFQATFRDVIGYIAGLGGACAKFGRDGSLCFKTLEQCGFTLLRDNYSDLSMKQDVLEIGQINVKVSDCVFSSGDGTRLTTYVVENQFGSQALADSLYLQWHGFSYYGMEIEMQGIPFLESGDSIIVQNDADNGLFRAIVSEIDYSYDGALRAVLSSKSKNPVDDYEDSVGKDETETLTENLLVVYYTYSNPLAATITAESAAFVDLDITAAKFTNAVLNGQLVARASEDCVLTLSYMLNGQTLLPAVYASFTAGAYIPLCLHNLLKPMNMGFNNLKLYASCTAGTVTVQAGGMVLTVWGQYLSDSSASTTPNREISESVPRFAMLSAQRSALFGEILRTQTQQPETVETTDDIPLFSICSARRTVTVSDGGASLPCLPLSATVDQYNSVSVYFSNDIVVSGSPAAAFSLRVTVLGVVTVIPVQTAVMNGTASLTLTPSQIFTGAPLTEVLFDGSEDSVCGYWDGAPVGDFCIEAEEIEIQPTQ